MKLQRSTFAICFFFTTHVYASWFCREAASQAQGDTFFACGYFESKDLMKAREGSLEAAKREFRAFCDDSKNCKDHAYTISPMRTDCVLEKGLHRCYRGVEYSILPEKQSNTFVDKASIKRQIQDKERELTNLQESLSDINKLEVMKQKVEKLKKMDQAEVELTELRHIYKDYQEIRNFGVFVGVHVLPLKNNDTKGADNVLALGFGVEYQYHLWRNVFGKMSISYVGIGGDDKMKDRGTANTRSETKYHSYSGLDANLSFPINFKNFAIIPNLGFLVLGYKSTQIEYNNFGVGLNKIEKEHKYNTGYAGLGFRFGNEIYVGLEPRYFFKDRKIGGATHVGILVNF